MPTRSYLLPSLMFAVWGCLCIAGASSTCCAASVAEPALPQAKVSISAPLLSAMPPRDRGYFTWPSVEQIAERRSDTRAVRIRRSGEVKRWVRLVLNPDVIPEDLEARLVALLGDVRERAWQPDADRAFVNHDAFRALWDSDAYEVRLTATMARLAVAISRRGPHARPSPDTAEGQREVAERIIRRFINDPETLISRSVVSWDDRHHVLRARARRDPELGPREIRWNTVFWWYTNGASLALIVVKADGTVEAAERPAYVPDWLQERSE